MNCERLRIEIDAFYQGFGHGPSLLSAFRSAVLVVPLTADDRVWSSEVGGVGWIPAFTGEPEFARFALARQGEVEARFHTLYGWRIMDEVAAGFTRPTGVMVDALGAAPMAFPPSVEPTTPGEPS
ncbi:hypothetical protein [Rhodococcus rhodnii]|uniref:SseB protein N-terminal domain-containing protein n=1 Tax=Rhodococcus rhodnii LMG 5362 TaxID=1273125 RepID=R7WKK8_9NOCA|nr:hypothetical protein [Rhodococcus rhodnii]EOM75827.1 hypothetical protein Rrhod_2733 [Rhodococcus rhodnii LMG 5362]